MSEVEMAAVHNAAATSQEHVKKAKRTEAGFRGKLASQKAANRAAVGMAAKKAEAEERARKARAGSKELRKEMRKTDAPAGSYAG